MAASRMLRTVVGLMVTVASLGPIPASAHAPGSAPVGKEGTVELGAWTPNSTANQLHVFVESGLMLPVQPGDTLAYNWSANGGLGPNLEFTVHNHQNGTYNWVEFSGPALDGSWKVTDNRSLMISFVNPTAYNVTLTYNFTLFAPPVAVSPALFLIPAIGGIAVGWFLWVRAGRPADEGGLDEAYPTDPAAKNSRRAREEE